MSTLYEKLLETSSQHKDSLKDLCDAYESCFAEYDQYKYLQKMYKGALQFVIKLEKEYNVNYEPYLCKLNPLRFYQYKKEFVPKLQDLREIMPLPNNGQLRPFSQFPAYFAAAGCPLLLGLPWGLVLSGMISSIGHFHFTTKQMSVFNTWKDEALLVDSIYTFLKK